MRKLSVLALAFLGACTSPAANGGQTGLIVPNEVGMVPGGAEGSCRNPSENQFAGREATTALGSEMLRATGAKIIRWVQPGMMVTMEFSPDRLTVRLDERNRVLTANCG